MKLRTILISLVTLNGLAISIFLYVYSVLQGTIKRESQLPGEPLYFTKPITAYHLLKYFDVYEPLDEKFIKMEDPPRGRQSEPNLGLDLDNDYCAKVRAYTIDNS
jgi:hypothetical protein